MIHFPHCKINLGLHITARRKDGFHEIETCFYPVRGFRDAIEILPGETDGVAFSSTGLRIDCPVDKNLCVRAYHLLRDDFPKQLKGTRIHLHKHIPFGAGLGGGSADATAVLTGLNELYQLGLSVEELAGYAGKLGSDTVFFLHDRPMIGRGRGEQLTAAEGLDLSGWWIVMVKPEVSVSTAAAYAAVTPHKPPYDLEAVLRLPVEEWRGKLVNNFEAPVFEKWPELRKIKETLYNQGATYAAMSGSGSTVFGLFRDKPTVCQDDWNGGLVYSGQL